MWYAIGKREGYIWHGATYKKNLNFFHNDSNQPVNSAKDNKKKKEKKTDFPKNLNFFHDYSNQLVKSAKAEKKSKKNLALQIDIDSQTLTRCLAGKNFPSVDTILKIGRYEGKSVSYLIGENKEENTTETTIVDYLGITNDTYRNLVNIRNTNKGKSNKNYDILGELLTNVDLYKKIMNEIISLKSKKNITKDEIEFSVFKISSTFNELTTRYIKGIL